MRPARGTTRTHFYIYMYFYYLNPLPFPLYPTIIVSFRAELSVSPWAKVDNDCIVDARVG